jgi:hypothetical protein
MNSTSVIAFIILIVLVIVGIYIGWKALRERPSPANLAALVKAATTSVEGFATNAQSHVGRNSNASIYPKRMTDRKSLYDYLQTIGSISSDQLALSNFYVMTANLGGAFMANSGGAFPRISNAAFSPVAIQYALQAGVRCIVFDIWPDIRKGANMGPILQFGQNDASLKTLSPYTMEFDSALQMVQQEGFANSANPARNDPLFLFLRFRGNPTTTTYSKTADAIAFTLEPYRLANVFTSKTNNPLFSTPISELFSKIIILSNKSSTGTRLDNYINNPVQPPTSSYKPEEIHSLANQDLQTMKTKTSQNNILLCAPLPEDTDKSETNSWNWKEAQAAGIQLCGLNIWSMDANLGAYMDPSMFGTYSFAIKPDNLRYKIERIAPPIKVKNPGYGDGSVNIK